MVADYAHWITIGFATSLVRPLMFSSLDLDRVPSRSSMCPALWEEDGYGHRDNEARVLAAGGRDLFTRAVDWAIQSDFGDIGGLDRIVPRRRECPEPDWPGSAADRGKFSNEYRRLLPAPPEHWFGPFGNVLHSFREQEKVDRLFWISTIVPLSLPADGFGSCYPLPKVARWITGQLAAARLSEPEIAKLLVDPARMIVVSYWLIRRRARVLRAIPDYMQFRRDWHTGSLLDESFVRDELIAALLSLAALGACAYLERFRCTLCFREASPNFGHRARGRCAEHSLAKANLQEPCDRRERVAAVRKARKMAAAYPYGQLPPWLDKEDRQRRIEREIAGMLWIYQGERHAGWVREIGECLSRAPIVRALLPPDFVRLSHRAQLRALRNAVDPNHWQIDLWSQKIRVAEAWFTEERRLIKPRPKGMWPINRDRVATAQALLEDGFTKSEVAERLGISRSYLSHLLERANLAGSVSPRR